MSMLAMLTAGSYSEERDRRDEMKDEVAEDTDLNNCFSINPSTLIVNRRTQCDKHREAVCQHSYLVELIFVSIAFVSSVLSSSVDLTLIAGLRRQTIIFIALLELARET